MAGKPSKRFRCPKHWTLAQRLDYYTDKSGGPDACWPWMGTRDRKGYGMLKWMGKARLVPRLAWMEAHGPIPEGIQVCHKCDNPPCRNEMHLWLGGNDANAADMAAKGRSSWGAANRGAKVTKEQVLAIRAAPGRQVDIGKQFGLSRGAVSNIVLRKSWKHL